ncbi:DUF4468 domain-containing protein [Adhaeribacter swui]|uniref:DUF4468 domain-containing protein n=1 Tax=Adhaeribacter swui TaxID=2086471 RepID=A0A7G7G2N4_9BACT|nr:DUF4468 domain-containing protein [Adhaeribacter swui]QNF31418.1 DUF4468 domain-containing protein [Adhaeribacter swui]
MSSNSIKTFLCLILLAFTTAAPAQTLPIDAATRKIYYAEEVLVKDGPQLELYHRAKAWFAKGGKSAGTIQVDDLRNGVLIGTNNLLLRVSQNTKTQPYRLGYTVKFEMEDDCFWYSLTNFTLQKLAEPELTTNFKKLPQDQPLETILKSDNKNSLNNKRLQNAAHTSILALIEEIKKSMN